MLSSVLSKEGGPCWGCRCLFQGFSSRSPGLFQTALRVAGQTSACQKTICTLSPLTKMCSLGLFSESDGPPSGTKWDQFRRVGSIFEVVVRFPLLGE